MAWPQSQDYNEAIQSPQTCFKDPQLKAGQPATNPLGVPLPCSGNFADVYQVRCPDGTRWAVKCFTRGDANALLRRYEEIDSHLQQAKLPFAVGFRYLEEGVRVRGQWHPALKMQWVEGFTLNQFVRDNLDKLNLLDGLLQIWGRMAKRLREGGLAHADLQHGNVLLVPGSGANALGVRLIDYDGMWVPALAGQRSGEVGHPAYQHPQRLADGTYNKEVDRFPLLVVAAALRCLRVSGRTLWEKFDNGDNLLFRESDLKEPDVSPLFQELAKVQDAQARLLVDAVRTSSRKALAQAPWLDELLPETDGGKKATGMPTARKPAPGQAVPAGEVQTVVAVALAAPAHESQFADIDDAGDGTVVRPRRQGATPAWRTWAIVGGGVAALLLTAGLIAALPGGDNKSPDEPYDGRTAPRAAGGRVDGPDNDPKDEPPKADVRPKPQPVNLVLADLHPFSAQVGGPHQYSVRVVGVAAPADFQAQLSGLPPGMTAAWDRFDPGTGRAWWNLRVEPEAAEGASDVTVTVRAGGARADGEFRLTVVNPRPAPPPRANADAIEAVYQAMRLTPLEVGGGPFKPGNPVVVRGSLKNTLDRAILPPLRMQVGAPKASVGTRQAWVERLGNNFVIPAKRAAMAQGRRYAAGGAVISSEGVIPAGHGIPVTHTVSTEGYPPGRYKFYLQYKEVGGKVLQEVSVEFELAGN